MLKGFDMGTPETVARLVLKATEDQLADPEWVADNILPGEPKSFWFEYAIPVLRLRMFVAERRAFREYLRLIRRYVIYTVVIAVAAVVSAATAMGVALLR